MSARAAAAALLVVAACSERARPTAPQPVIADAAVDAEDEGLARGDGDPDEAPQEERIAAVEHAMNALAPVANQCWAAAASDDFRLAGSIRALVAVSEGGARVELIEDTARDATLATCLVAVLEAYPWASPLRGQTIELPFRFTAPAMQNLIDRRLVAHQAQAGLDVAVLLDERNSGNPALAIVDVRAEAGRTIGPRRIDRTELWRFTSAAAVLIGKTASRVAPGDLLLAPAGATVQVAPVDGAVLSATLVMVPGGALGVARAGALPAALPSDKLPASPAQVITAARTKRWPRTGGAATIFVEKGPLSATLLELDAGVTVPEHVHAKETEALYVLEGGGTMTIAGVAVPVDANAVIQIPPGVPHAFTATAATRALQLYTPPGPEQRFKTMK